MSGWVRIQTPTTSTPVCRPLASIAAATLESTPPLMAATIRVTRPMPPRARRHRVAQPPDGVRARRDVRSTCSAVVSRPTVMRSEPCAASGSMPIASRTCDGSVLPRGAGAAGRRLDPLQVERRHQVAALDALDHEAGAVRQPFGRVAGEAHALGIAVEPGAIRRSRAARRLGSRHRGRASSSARAKPTMPATFSVPARRCRSCAPPCIWGSSAVPRPHEQRPDALRPVDLVRGQAQEVDAQRIDVERQVAGGLHRIGMEQDPCARGRWHRSRRSAGWCRPRCWRT